VVLKLNIIEDVRLLAAWNAVVSNKEKGPNACNLPYFFPLSQLKCGRWPRNLD
jgi:hypothetical protein